MNGGYSWNDARDGGTYRLPGPEHLGWWATVAMVVSVLLHVAIIIVLNHFETGLSFTEAREISTGPVDVRQAEVLPLDVAQSDPPEDVVVPPDDLAALLEEVDLIDSLPQDQEIDIKPEQLEPEYALKLSNPAAEGVPEALAPELSTRMEIDSELPDLGRIEETLPVAAVGQVTVDPGAVKTDDLDLTKFTDDLLKKGANGTVKAGALDGVTSLDALIGLPANVLIGKKTMLPSDLLFEFNSAELRESAKVGLMKLGLLMDLNPKLYCWIEGHTDLVGGDAFNLDLSRRRAAAVRAYLVNSMKMDPDKIIPRGIGKYEPLVTSGTVEEQAPNRRVEIRMRKTLPPPEPVREVRSEDPPPPRAVLVKPGRVVPVEPSPPSVPPPPRAKPVPEPPPRAKPVPEILDIPVIPRAEPVDPNDPVEFPPPIEIPRARAIGE